MLSSQIKQKLKKDTVLYAQMPIHLNIDESNQCYSQIKNHQASITLGEKAPYHYLEHFHPQGYEMFMEGLLFHELASLRYCDFQILSQTYIQASQALTQVNSAAKDFLNKQMSYRELKSIITNYVFQTNLPLVLKAIEEGAVENALGIDFPETWNPLMYARQAITSSFLKEKHQQTDTAFLMDKIIKEIMVICTYGYQISIK